MPSPFPGMDPFLEHPIHFPDLHDNLVAYLREFLQGVLPEPYYAATGDRVWVEVSRRYIGPDVKVLRSRDSDNGTKNGGTAVAASSRTQPAIVHVPHDERRETFVEIYTQDEHERLVASIEVLSLTNKTPGEHGRDLYLRKQREILDRQVHLVEIDLLRAGTHSTAVPLDFALAQSEPFDYHVCLRPFDDWENFRVYGFRLESCLPEIEVPLLPGHGSVCLDLQGVFNRCYDSGPYRRRVRYASMGILPPLDAERTAWASGVLRDKGLLPPAPAS
ncbi:MAG: DUF4058 family protein [Gemmataceae bacterium]|nr:DUF4058 family protein [Gemmataceae bacterium]